MAKKAEKKFWVYVDLGSETLLNKVKRAAGPRKTASWVRELIKKKLGAAGSAKKKSAAPPVSNAA